MAQVIAGLIALFFSFGFTEVIIQRKELTEEVKETAFVSSFFFSIGAICISGIVLLILGIYVDNVIVSYIFIFEMIGVVFTLLSVLPTAILLRELKMSAFTKRTLISRVVFFVVSIPLASMGYGIWSIVYGNLTQSFISFFLLLVATRKVLPKKINFNFSIFIQLFSFGFYVMAENILWNVLSRVFSLLVASFHGSYALGLYNIATKITDTILNVLNTVVSRMALPLFSQVQDDHSKLKDIFSKSTAFFNMISMPTFIGMAITCDQWVPIVLGDKWIDAIPIIQIISVMNAIMYSRIFVGTAMKAVGQSKRFMILSVISAILSVLTVFATKHLSLEYVMASWSFFRIVITIPIGIFLMKKIIGVNTYEQLSPVFISTLSTLIMSLVLLYFDGIFHQVENIYIRFFATFLLGFLLYVVTYLALAFTNNKWRK